MDFGIWESKVTGRSDDPNSSGVMNASAVTNPSGSIDPSGVIAPPAVPAAKTGNGLGETGLAATPTAPAPEIPASIMASDRRAPAPKNDWAYWDTISKNIQPDRPPAPATHGRGVVQSTPNKGVVPATPNKGPGVLSTPGKAANPNFPKLENYEILSELGRGGMGVVYKAKQRGLNRTVALKMILTGESADPVDRQRFMIEAESAANLQHPNIVQVYELGEQDNKPFMVLEYLDGGMLSDKLKGEPQPPREAAEMLETLSRAMHLAHSRGIIHRDLKPSNVLLSSEGTLKISDFGLAKKADTDIGATTTGAIVGTPAFMSPEQAEGKVRDIGPSVDIYSLGAMLYYFLTGRPPLLAPTAVEMLLMVKTQDPLPPSRLQPKVPRDLDTICMKCLQKLPSKRYLTADELANDLRRFLDGEPIHARPVPPLERAYKWIKRHPTTTFAMVTGVLGAFLGVGALAFGFAYYQDEFAKAERKLTLKVDLDAARSTAEGHLKKATALRAQGGDALPEAVTEYDAVITSVDASVAKHEEFADDDTLTQMKEQATEQRDQTRQQVGRANEIKDAKKNYAAFKAAYAEALFQATLITAADLASNIDRSTKAIKTALGHFGVSPDTPHAPALDPVLYAPAEQKDVQRSCYELLVALAEMHSRRATVAGAADDARAAAFAAALATLRGAGTLAAEAKLGEPSQGYYLRQARYLRQLNRAAEADAAEKAAKARKPDTAADYFYLGEELYRQRKYKDAAAEFKKSVELADGAENFWAFYLLAVCQLKAEQYKDARSTLTTCIEKRRDFLWSYLLRGFANGELKDFEDALKDFEYAEKKDPDVPTRYGLLLTRGLMYIRQDQYGKAVAEFEAAVGLQPQLYEGYVNLAQALQKAKKYDAAVEQYDRAITMAPPNPALYRNRATALLDRGDLKRALSGFRDALETQQQLLGGAPAGAQTAREMSEDHIERATILYRLRQYEEAIAECVKALKLREAVPELKTSPETGRIHFYEGRNYLELALLPGKADVTKELKDAIAEFDLYEQASPVEAAKDVELFRQRGLAKARLGDFSATSGAIKDYTVAIATAPKDTKLANLYVVRGWAYLSGTSPDPRRAAADFEEAVRLDDKNGVALNAYAYSLAKRGRPDEALDKLEKSLKHCKPADRSVGFLLNTARTYSQIVAKFESLNRSGGEDARRISKCRDDAAKFLTESLAKVVPNSARGEFWRSHLHVRTANGALGNIDPDFVPLATHPKFIEMDAEYTQTKSTRR